MRDIDSESDSNSDYTESVDESDRDPGKESAVEERIEEGPNKIRKLTDNSTFPLSNSLLNELHKEKQ